MAGTGSDRVYNVMIPIVANVAAPTRAEAIAALRRLVEEHRRAPARRGAA